MCCSLNLKNMKSLRSLTLENEMFTPEIIKWILDEGFKLHSNDSYCFRETNLGWEDKCYHKYIDGSGFDINVYIFATGIGVDIDYDCGGNSSNTFWKFSDYKDFEEVYDLMVTYVGRY